MLGGLARRVAYVAKVRADTNRKMLVFDSGGLFTNGSEDASSPAAKEKAQRIARAYRRMGAAAVNVGTSDLLMGVAFLRAEAKKKLPILSANLVYSSNKTPLFPPFLIRDVDGIRIGVTGLLSPDWTPAVRRAAGSRVAALNPAAAAAEALKNLRGRADIVMLLSDLNAQEEKEVVEAVSGIHFVLGGREGRFGAAPIGREEIPRLQSYRHGMYVGRLDLQIAQPGLPIVEKNRLQRTESQLREKEDLLHNLKKWEGEDTAPGLLRRIKETEKEIERLREVLRWIASSPEYGNFYQWLMIPLDVGITEDPQVRKWFEKKKKSSHRVPG